MSLPKIATHHETVDVAGALFDLGSITAAQAARFHKMQEADCAKDELEVEVIGASTSTPLDEVWEWYAATPRWAVEELIVHIKRVSRLEEGAQKSGGESDSPGGG